MSREGCHEALRFELCREQAASLGRAGAKLEQALAAYRALGRLASHASDGEWCRRRDEVATRIDALLLQREAVGLRRDNLAWLQATYRVPGEILARLACGPPA